MSDETTHQPLEGVEAEGAKNIPRRSITGLASGDAPCATNPTFTRKEAWEAGVKHGRLPMTEEIADGIAAHVIQGTPSQQIAQQFGYAPRYASQLPKHPSVRKSVRDALERAGAGIDRAAKKANDLLDAKKTEFAKDKGKITDTMDVEDNATQLGALRTVLEAYGAIGQSPTKASGGGEAGSRIVIVNAEEAVFFGMPMGATDGAGSPGPRE